MTVQLTFTRVLDDAAEADDWTVPSLARCDQRRLLPFTLEGFVLRPVDA
jgi:hypothetical protein